MHDSETEVAPDLIVEVFEGEGEQPFHYRLRYTTNGQIMMTSEGHVHAGWARNRGHRLAEYLGCDYKDLTLEEV